MIVLLMKNFTPSQVGTLLESMEKKITIIAEGHSFLVAGQASLVEGQASLFAGQKSLVAGQAAIVKKLAEHDGRFDAIDQTLENVQEQIDQVGTVVLKDHEKRIVAVEKRLGVV